MLILTSGRNQDRMCRLCVGLSRPRLQRMRRVLHNGTGRRVQCAIDGEQRGRSLAADAMHAHNVPFHPLLKLPCLHQWSMSTKTGEEPQGQEEQPLGQLPPHVSLPDAAAGWGDGAEEGDGRHHTSAEKPSSCSTIGGKALVAVQTEGFGFWWVSTSPR